MDFDKRLKRAIHRGQSSREAVGRAKAEQAMNEEELRTLHSRLRLELSEHIEICLRKLADHFPGFAFSVSAGGASITRDDVDFSRQRRARNLYSRLEMAITPFSTATPIVEMTSKGTIRNKETQNRNHYQFLAEADIETFKELIDLWVLEFAEQYAANQ
jgi:hypothetical protein